MKALIDIPDAIVPALAALCEQEKISRSEAVRRAIEQYVVDRRTDQKSQEEKTKGIMSVFGAWKGTTSECDGVELQRRLRAEWGHRDPDI